MPDLTTLLSNFLTQLYAGSWVPQLGLTTISVDNIVLVQTDALVLQNRTLATAGVTVQRCPRLHFLSHVWNSTSGADNTDEWFISSRGTTGAVPGSQIAFYNSRNGADPSLTQLLTLSTSASANAFASFINNCIVGWSGRAAMSSAADGQWNLTNNAATAGIGFDVTTDGTVKVRVRGQNAYGTVDALGFKASGTAIDTEPAGFVDAGNSGSALTLNLATSRHQKLTLTGNVTLTLNNPTDGARYVIEIQTGAGSFTVTWPAAVVWSGGVAPTITPTASKVDIVVLVYDSVNAKYYGSIAQNF